MTSLRNKFKPYIDQFNIYRKNPLEIFNNWANLGRLNWMPDKWYLSFLFRSYMGYWMNWNAPKTFNEKLQWLKLYDRNPFYSNLVDKLNVRKYISKKIGSSYLIPLLNHWKSFDEIDFDSLPNQFVLKCSHDSGSVIVCKEKKELDLSFCKKKLSKALNRNFYFWAREWPYKNVQPCIIAEKYESNLSDKDLVVYKVICMNGEPQIIQVIQNDKTIDETIDYFDTNWNLLDLKQNYPNSIKHIKKPVKLNDMLSLSEKLAQGITQVRIDWYVIRDQLKFSEFTFFSDAGLRKFTPSKWDLILGEQLKLPPKKSLLKR